MRNSSRLLGFVVAATLGVSPWARADPAQPMGVPDIIGARGLSLGAYRGIPAGNDGIFTNAASLAAMRRYSIEGQWLLGRFHGVDSLQLFSASVVDSQTTSVTGGLSFTRVLSGPWIGNAFHVPVAFPLSGGLFLGLVGKYQSLNGPAGDGMRAANVDLSAYWRMSQMVGLGVSGYNLLEAGHKLVQPRAIGVGVSVGDDRSYHLSADWRGDFVRRGELSSLFAFGGEYLAGAKFPLRASYVRDGTRDQSYWTIGAGFVTSSGFAVDAAYRQGIDDSEERVFSAGIKMFVPQQ